MSDISQQIQDLLLQKLFLEDDYRLVTVFIDGLFSNYTFRLYHGPGVDSATSKKEYQEHFLGVKTAGA